MSFRLSVLLYAAMEQMVGNRPASEKCIRRAISGHFCNLFPFLVSGFFCFFMQKTQTICRWLIIIIIIILPHHPWVRCMGDHAYSLNVEGFRFNCVIARYERSASWPGKWTPPPNCSHLFWFPCFPSCPCLRLLTIDPPNFSFFLKDNAFSSFQIPP